MANTIAKIKIKNLNASSLNALMGSTSDDLKAIADSVNAFYGAVSYSAGVSALSVSSISTNTLTIGQKIELVTNGTSVFSVDAQGNMLLKSVKATNVETKTLKLDEFPESQSTTGSIGSIVWTGNDFMGYTNGGWVSLTTGASGGGTGGGGNSAYGDTNTLTLVNGTAGVIKLGFMTTTAAINVVYHLVRGSLVETGVINVYQKQDGTLDMFKESNVTAKTNVRFIPAISVDGYMSIHYDVLIGADNAVMHYAFQIIKQQ